VKNKSSLKGLRRIAEVFTKEEPGWFHSSSYLLTLSREITPPYYSDVVEEFSIPLFFGIE